MELTNKEIGAKLESMILLEGVVAIHLDKKEFYKFLGELQQ